MSETPAVGIIHVDVNIDLIPGDVGNAASYDYPVLYDTIEDCSVEEAVAGEYATVASRIVATAKRLEAASVRIIAADCGTLVRYQRVVAAAVRVPVLLSPLVGAPMIAAMLGADRRVAIVVASEQRTTRASLADAGLSDANRFTLLGLQDLPTWRAAIIEESGTLDARAIESEVVDATSRLVAHDRTIGAFVFECADLPPYAAAVQAATALPVFDMVTMIDYAYRATHVSRGYAWASR